MADEIDSMVEREQYTLDAAVENIREAAKRIPKGEPGLCDKCGNEMPRIVEGLCCRCRDEYNRVHRNQI